MEERSSSTPKRAVANVVTMTSGQLLAMAVLTVSGFLIARVMGVEAYGRFSAVLALVSILLAVSRLGLQQVSVRFLPPLWQAGDRSRALTLGSTIWTVRLASALLVGVVGSLWMGATVASDQNTVVVVALGLLCTLRSVQEAILSIFLSIDRIGRLTLFELLHAVLRLPVVLGSFLAFGLPGVFAALPFLHMGVSAWSLASLRRLFPLRLRLFRWSALRDYVAYSLSAYVWGLCAALQLELSIYAVAIWGTERDAGLLALAMRLYLLVRGLFLAAYRSQKPLLAKIEAAGQCARLRSWGETIMAVGVAGACSATLTWAVLGRGVLQFAFGDDFAPVYPLATVLLASLIPLSAAMMCQDLLYLRRRPGTALLNAMAYTGVLVGGLFLVLGRGDASSAAIRIAWVYLIASAFFFVATHASLRRRGALGLPLGRTLLLALPAVLVLPAVGWEASLVTRLLALIAFLVLYGLAVGRLGLVPRSLLDAYLRRSGHGARNGEADDIGLL